MRTILFLLALPALAQVGTTNGEWRSYGGDLGHTRYAPLDQINASNFKDLEIAWRFKTDALALNTSSRARR
jgi:glucose dehydrogenase